jgi:hypothetical protein
MLLDVRFCGKAYFGQLVGSAICDIWLTFEGYNCKIL